MANTTYGIISDIGGNQIFFVMCHLPIYQRWYRKRRTPEGL